MGAEEEPAVCNIELSDFMKKVLKDSQWISIATKSEEGFHVIAVWDAVQIDKSTLGFYAAGMFATKENLEKDPYVELMAVSKEEQNGFRFSGKGVMVPKKDLPVKVRDKMQRFSNQFFEMSHSILLMDVECAKKLL